MRTVRGVLEWPRMFEMPESNARATHKQSPSREGAVPSELLPPRTEITTRNRTLTECGSAYYVRAISACRSSTH